VQEQAEQVERARQAMEEMAQIMWEQEKMKAKPLKKVSHREHLCSRST
jgi:hypothetical protein